MKKQLMILIILGLTFAQSGRAQITVNPSGVNVNTHGATTVFLSFGRLVNQVPVEAFWCGELIAAAPDIGFKCDPGSLFGRLPIRYDLSKIDASGRFTDIMSIPPSVARRAYQAAQQGSSSQFFYVRRFVSTVGGPDEYVSVTCRLAGGGGDRPAGRGAFPGCLRRIRHRTRRPTHRGGRTVPRTGSRRHDFGTPRRLLRPGQQRSCWCPKPGRRARRSNLLVRAEPLVPCRRYGLRPGERNPHVGPRRGNA